MKTPQTVLALVAALVVLAVPVGAQKPRKNINDASVAALQTWVEAVRTHASGRPDASVATVAAFSYETREDLNTGINLFFAALMAWRYDTDNNKAAQTIVAIGHAAGKDFLKRAAVLHSDVAAYGDVYSATSSGAATAPVRRTQDLHLGRGGKPQTFALDEPIPPLLMADRVLLGKDGQLIGDVVRTWNWPFARSLLDLLSAGPRKKILSDGRPERATDPFVSAWYHATTAYMFAEELYGEATSHLHHASMVLPDDALAVFDRACYAEILGLPMHQVLIRDVDVGQRARAGGAPTWTTPSSEPALRIPAAAETNAEAERLFRRALAIDPSLAEARVRLARLLDLRGRHEEAAAELSTALAAKPPAAVAFYAHLFGARAAQALGHIDDASRHSKEALDLFPDAQSALLAASQLAFLRSDVPATLAPVARLGARSTVFTADPWWQYHRGAGRDAEGLLNALWAGTPRDRPR
jgi:tetratricopeptide (TPR) repeat protein